MNPITKILAELGLLSRLQKAEAYRPRINNPTPQKRVRAGGSTKRLHEQSKNRRKMAAASNRINRKRIRNWKH